MKLKKQLKNVVIKNSRKFFYFLIYFSCVSKHRFILSLYQPLYNNFNYQFTPL